MKRMLIIASLLAGFEASAVISSNLVADWQAGVGIVASGGRISQWNDQHQTLNNDGLGPHNLTQTNAPAQPYDTTDARGNRGVMFPWSFFAPQPNTGLNIPNSLGGLDTDNTTIYVVATGPMVPTNQTLIWPAGLASGWIRFSQPSNFPASLQVGSSGSTIYPPLNLAVFVGASDTNATTLRWNNLSRTNAAQPRVTTGNGGTIGSINGSEFYYGIIYRMLVYKAAHTAAQMDAQVAELAGLYGVRTHYTKQAVCRGASTSEGVGSTMLQSYEFQLAQRYPEIAWHDQGLYGTYLGTNGLTGSMYDIDGNYVDTLFDGGLQRNWLFMLAGLNDVYTGGQTGFSTWQRLTNYVAARKAAHPWTVVVSTLQADIVAPAGNADYNACIRTNGGPWDALVDPGVNSPVETRLSNPNNTTYFYSDGVHLSNLGYGVLADHFGQIVNVPHRTTGFFGP